MNSSLRAARRNPSPRDREAVPREHISRAAARRVRLRDMRPSRFLRTPSAIQKTLAMRFIAFTPPDFDSSLGSGGFGCGSRTGQQLRTNHAVLLQRFVQKRLASGVLMLDAQRCFHVRDFAQRALCGSPRNVSEAPRSFVVSHGIGEPIRGGSWCRRSFARPAPAARERVSRRRLLGRWLRRRFFFLGARTGDLALPRSRFQLPAIDR